MDLCAGRRTTKSTNLSAARVWGSTISKNICYETLRVHLGLANWLPLIAIAEMKGLMFDGGSALTTNIQHVLVLRGSLLVLYHHDKIGTRFIP